MRKLARVLQRAVAAEFYRRYVGGLIVGGLLLGGVLSSTEHVTLIREAIHDARVLVGVYLLPWALYTALSGRFAFHLWSQATYESLRDLLLVPSLRRWAVGLRTQALILAPCWAYGAVIIGFAVQAGRGQSALVTAGALSLLTAAGWLAHEVALRRGAAGSGPLTAGRMLGRAWPPALWSLRAQLRDRFAGLVVLKLVSVASIWGLCRVFTPDTFDARLLTLGALLTTCFHLRLPAEWYAWERTRLALRWNMPIAPRHRWGEQARLMGTLLLPELIAWARWCPLPAPDRWIWAVRLTLFPAVVLLLAGASLLRWPRHPADFLGPALAVAFGVYLLLLTRVPLEVLTVAAALGSWWLTRRFYWRVDDPPPDPGDRVGSSYF